MKAPVYEKMKRYAETLVLLLCLGGGLFVLDRPIQRQMSSYVDIFEVKDMIAARNHSVGNLRKASPPSSLIFPIILPPTLLVTDKNSLIADFTQAATFESKPQQHSNEPKNIENKKTDYSKPMHTTEDNDSSAKAPDVIKRRENNDEIESSSDEGNVTKTTNVISNSNILVWNTGMYTKLFRPREKNSIGTQRFESEIKNGYIKNNEQLVVDVDETYLFWHDGQEKLCKLLQNMTLATSLDATGPVPSTLLNATMDCIYHNKHKQGYGQGNWITAIYAARMAAYLAGVDFQFQCLDGQNSKMSLLLPWFDKYQRGNPVNRTVWPLGGDRPNAKEACTPKYEFLRIDKMAFETKDDLQKMAVSLVGTRDEVRRHPEVPVDAKPLIPDIQLDDVALHFRCGDVLGGARRNDFGMIRFNEYKKWIPNNMESIRILTQPFEKDRNRGQDKRKADNCRTVVYALVDYLQEFAPKAKISIHNGVNETHPLTYARLVMANYSITSLSSFGIFPIIGVFGQGYFQKGNYGVNPFATHVPNILKNVHQMEANVRGTGQMMGKSIENLVEWFVNDTAIA